MIEATDENNAQIKPSRYTPQHGGAYKKSYSKFWPLVVIILLMAAIIAWFSFTAKAVKLVFEPQSTMFNLTGGLTVQLSGTTLARSGTYELTAKHEGYYPLVTQLRVTKESSQEYLFDLQPLPGLVNIKSEPNGATIALKSGSSYEIIGNTPLFKIPLTAGSNVLRVTKARYKPLITEILVEGKSTEQEFSADLTPNWGDVTIRSNPSRAMIYINGNPTGKTTPAQIEILEGEHEVSLHLTGHKPRKQKILVNALDKLVLPQQNLVKADASLTILASTSNTSVTINGKFIGTTPLTVQIKSDTSQVIKTFKPGYKSITRKISLAPNENRSVNLTIPPITGMLSIVAVPPEANLFVNGKNKGPANQLIELPSTEHEISIKLDGYAGYTARITPADGMTKEVKVRLLTNEEARKAALPQQLTTKYAHELLLIQPNTFEMGASRREPGRRANETLREVRMKRMFYLSKHEVSNKQFLQFAQGHDSGIFEERRMNEEDQPVVNISWEEAALYCNWLSELEGLPLFYRTELGKVIGFNADAIGYRLPSEAEWAFAMSDAVDHSKARFPWGDSLPPPERHGNYADRSAANLVGRVVFGYNDNYIVSAPIGTFPPDRNGLYDMSGNVAEWVHDYYTIADSAISKDPLGLDQGDYHVIRGSSWMHGTITDLRRTFRDYGAKGRKDVGFRIARYAQ
tara:strand:- start:396 stop:2456 length:2061 start_codon:yes stop_codon:yes gene_type:complete